MVRKGHLVQPRGAPQRSRQPVLGSSVPLPAIPRQGPAMAATTQPQPIKPPTLWTTTGGVFTGPRRRKKTRSPKCRDKVSVEHQRLLWFSASFSLRANLFCRLPEVDRSSTLSLLKIMTRKSDCGDSVLLFRSDLLFVFQVPCLLNF